MLYLLQVGFEKNSGDTFGDDEGIQHQLSRVRRVFHTQRQ